MRYGLPLKAGRLLALAILTVVTVTACDSRLEPVSDPVPSQELERMVRFADEAYAQCAPLMPVLTGSGIECREG
jgi:hypothetical protein